MVRGDELAMVYQGATGEERFWSVPSGRVESGELVTEGLVREVAEETGLQIVDPGRLAFVLQIDNRRDELPGEGRGPRGGYHATVWTFAVESWGGDVAPSDPDGLVVEAGFVPMAEAITHLAKLEWQSVTVEYLLGKLEPGSLVQQRWHGSGTIEELARISRP